MLSLQVYSLKLVVPGLNVVVGLHIGEDFRLIAGSPMINALSAVNPKLAEVQDFAFEPGDGTFYCRVWDLVFTTKSIESHL